MPLALPVIPTPDERERKRAGCLKWGLVGCAGLSIFLIVGLIYMAGKGLDLVMGTLESQILVACAPDVTPADREAFQKAFETFVSRSKKGGVSSDEMAGFRKRTMAALADGKVTREELVGLTEELRKTSR